jgi:hypothetical protein
MSSQVDLTEDATGLGWVGWQVTDISPQEIKSCAVGFLHYRAYSPTGLVQFSLSQSWMDQKHN